MHESRVAKFLLPHYRRFGEKSTYTHYFYEIESTSNMKTSLNDHFQSMLHMRLKLKRLAIFCVVLSFVHLFVRACSFQQINW